MRYQVKGDPKALAGRVIIYSQDFHRESPDVLPEILARFFTTRASEITDLMRQPRPALPVLRGDQGVYVLPGLPGLPKFSSIDLVAETEGDLFLLDVPDVLACGDYGDRNFALRAIRCAFSEYQRIFYEQQGGVCSPGVSSQPKVTVTRAFLLDHYVEGMLSGGPESRAQFRAAFTAFFTGAPFEEAGLRLLAELDKPSTQRNDQYASALLSRIVAIQRAIEEERYENARSLQITTNRILPFLR